ncbi:related to 60S ribosomal protein L20 [Cephalotrichum gorgonifer]|uniref:Related to 60S ribosomal protein L20 n=1 Tax=Cephalotrichum gorgonifer TaxID=2041049 RepID=A0AAE8SZ92_9PEZI|nr:related to 60S ribosomal protein L20 [Cephalotrichum gorgonifer]
MSSTLTRRPATALASSLRSSLSTINGTTTAAAPVVLVSRRSHQTTARTKRSLRIRPHPSHTLRNKGEAPVDEIVFNPPSSQPSVYHTPFKFLPPSDPRRSSNLRLLFNTPSAGAASASAEYLPPALTPTAEKKYHLTKEDVEEMRKLRWEDPETWSLRKLSEKFDCSIHFVQIATAVQESYKERLAEGTRRMKATWGPKKMKAREDRLLRKEMLFRGEL